MSYVKILSKKEMWCIRYHDTALLMVYVYCRDQSQRESSEELKYEIMRQGPEKMERRGQTERYLEERTMTDDKSVAQSRGQIMPHP